MRLKYCNYETWVKNHDDNHNDKIFRSLYPYYIFNQIDFAFDKINQTQEVYQESSKFIIKILSIELQDNGRFRATFFLNSEHNSYFTKWKYRTWQERFQIVYTQDFEFITVFTKNEDSSKKYLKNFFSGNFERITENRSIPISELLFKTLVSHIAENIFFEGSYEKEFPVLEKGIRNLKIPQSFKKGRTRKEFVYPLFSNERELWIFSAFNEEKAHKIAYFNCNQCKELYIVYCNPVYTKHFRCTHDKVHVVSLFEFSYILNKSILNRYSEQIRYLQNHLNDIPNYDIEKLYHEIENPILDEYEIYNSELLESLAIMKIFPTDNNDLFLYISAMNLLNCWINRNRQKTKKTKLIRNMYFFKTYLRDAISSIIYNKSVTNYNIYIERDLIIIELQGFQFSFHNVPINAILEKYRDAEINKRIIWKGKRLQPISPLIFRLAKVLFKDITNTDGAYQHQTPDLQPI